MLVCAFKLQNEIGDLDYYWILTTRLKFKILKTVKRIWNLGQFRLKTGQQVVIKN